jgi:hypothetical protein
MSAGSFSVVFVLGVITVLIVRSREVPWWQAALIYLFGYYTAFTPASYFVLTFSQSIFSRL